MPTKVTDAFGNEFETCSVSTQLKSAMSKKSFSSEAAWAKQVKSNAFTVIKMKIKNGEVQPGTVVARTPAGDRMTYKLVHGQPSFEIKTVGQSYNDYLPIDDLFVHDQKFFTSKDWDFGPNMVQLAKVQKEIVDSPAKLEDWLDKHDNEIDHGDTVATVKWQSGTARDVKYDGVGLNGKSQFKMDGDYGLEILDEDGLNYYVKSDQYEVKYKVGQTPDVPPAAGLPVSSTSQSVGALTNEDAATMFVKTKDKLAQEAGINIKGASAKLDDLVYKTISDQAGYTPTEMKAKVDAYKASGKKLSALKKKVVQKTGNSTKEATEAAIDKATAAVKKEELKPEEVVQVWDDEAVAKAYVKAKDHVVANNDKGWTLYTKNPDFDAKILQWMQADLGPIKQANADTAIANYIATKQKLSVLKKQMIKKGELTPQADTLKGVKKVAEAPGGNTATQKTATEILDELKAGKAAPGDTGAGQVGKATEDPTEVAPKHELTDVQKDQVKNTWENGNIPLSSSNQKVYEFAKTIANAEGLGDDILPILRWVDAYKAEKFGVTNANLYEKKAVEYLKNPTPAYKSPSYASAPTPAGKTFGELPEDSSLFGFMSPGSFDSMWKASAAPLKAEERAAVSKYTSSYYHEMNNHLRDLEKKGIQWKPTAKSVDDTIAKTQQAMRPLPQHVKVSRGTGIAQLGVKSVDEIPGLVGKTFVEPAFTSTSVGEKAAFGGNVGLVIEVPQGSLATWAKPISHFPGENELLLAKRTKYRVLRVEQKGYQTIVHVRVEGVAP